MKNLTFCLITLLSITLSAQEDIEQYLLTDSLEIQALVEQNVLLDTEEEAGPKVTAFTNFGLVGKQFSNLDDLNASLLSAGYGEIPSASLGWTFGNSIDVGNHITIVTSIFSNVFLNRFSEGVDNSSRYTYLSFLMGMAYRKDLGKFHLAPGLGLGFSQNYLTLKPNGLEEMDWDNLYLNNDLVVAVRQIDFAISTDLSIGKYFPKKGAGKHLLNLKLGMVFHPFSFVKPGIYAGEGNAVKLNGAPSLNSTGFNLMLTWG